MTIATDLGFEIGKLYRVVGDEGSSYYKTGMIVKFYEDDESTCPWFMYDSGPKGLVINGSASISVDLKDLEPVEAVRCTQTTKDLLILYVQQHHALDKVLNALVSAL